MIPRFGDDRDWFFSHRLGLFIHWGLYSLGKWHEQEQFRFPLPRDTYARRVAHFDAVDFEPDAWLDAAETAGMSYLCFTTKHVDGFCMWDTERTEYKVTNTPYGRDVLAMLAEACQRRGFPLCLYYSIADMHHPNYPNAGRSYELPEPAPGDAPDLDKYLEFVEAQVCELCMKYGDIAGFWWDANVLGHRDPRFRDLIRSLQPGAVINGRGFDGRWPEEEAGDFGTPERGHIDELGARLRAYTRPTEACQSVGVQSWGYREFEDYYTTASLIRSIDGVLARGGNYLLNVGPTAEGVFPPEALDILRAIGRWHAAVKEAFEDVEPASELTTNREVLLTRRGKVVYVHLHQPPVSRGVVLAPLAVQPLRATLLNTGEPVQTRVERLPSHAPASVEPCLRLYDLPVDSNPGTALVVKLEFDAPAPVADA